MGSLSTKINHAFQSLINFETRDLFLALAVRLVKFAAYWLVKNYRSFIAIH